MLYSVLLLFLQLEDSDDSEDSSADEEEKTGAPKIYRPPKLAAMHYGKDVSVINPLILKYWSRQ